MNKTLLVGGRIYPFDSTNDPQESLLFGPDGVIAAGTETELRKIAGNSPDIIDLEGGTAIPGFNDNHLHAMATGEFFSRPDLNGKGCEEIINYLKEFYRDTPAGKVLTGHGWDYPYCDKPEKSVLDTAFPDNPVVLFQFSGHAAWVNSAMLKKMKISSKTPDPEGGKIVRDQNGEATGLLLDMAVTPLHFKRFLHQNLIPTERTRLLSNALQIFREHGITSVQDNTWIPFTVGLYRSYRRRGLLTARFSCWSYGSSAWMRRLMAIQRFNRNWVAEGPEKYFLDGTFSTKTAWLIEPYIGEATNTGLPTGSQEWIEEILTRLAKKGKQGAFHAIGDQAVRAFINAVQNVSRQYPNIRDLRMRLEHAQLIHPDDIKRLRDLGILIAAQPHAMGSPEKDISLLGKERAETAYPLRSLIDAGVHLSFGSDIPGESTFDPMLAIHYAVNRSGPEQITVEEAIRAYTQGSAYAEFKEGEKGTLEPGMWADIAVLDRDPFNIPKAELKDTKVNMTICDGRLVFMR